MSDALLSETDAAVFGFPIARVFIDTPDDIEAAERFCREHGVRLLVARCRAEDIGVVHALTRTGHLLMDTQIRYACRVRTVARMQPDPFYQIRRAVETDAVALGELARDAFTGYVSHYHADPRLDRAVCDEVYVRWVLDALSAQRPGERLFVAERDGRLTGFGLSRVRDKVSEASLAGTARAEGAGRVVIYRALLQAGTRGALEDGVVRGVTSTNIVNVVVQQVWIRAGWTPFAAIHTFHRWFDE